MKNIFLIGFMGTGKSTVAKKLAPLLKFSVIDLDAQIENSQNSTISEIFATKGEAAFRDMEAEMIDLYANQLHNVIACGGGAVLRQSNVEKMKRNGVVVLLQAQPETIWARIKHNEKRPLLKGRMSLPYLTELMEERKNAYEQAADLQIATDGKLPGEIALEIMKSFF